MSKVTIGKKEFEVEEVLLNQVDLEFYPENPRIYSIVYANGSEPTQTEIEKTLKEKEHVKILKNSIAQNGGLLEPLIVKKSGNKYVVLEGNSRLAAYRLLAAVDSIKWSNVRCNILPDTVTEEDIFLLLGQLHIIGKTDWSVFEQAGYLYRTIKTSGKTVEVVAKMLGISIGEAKKQYEVYSYMVEQGDSKPSHWSYYDVLKRDRGLKNYIKTNYDFEKKVVEDIKAEAFQAIELRDKLGAIAKDESKDSKKIMKRYISSEATLQTAYDSFHDTGKDENVYKVIQKFREKITDEKFVSCLKSTVANGNKEVGYEIRKILKTLEKLKIEMEGQ